MSILVAIVGMGIVLAAVGVIVWTVFYGGRDD